MEEEAPNPKTKKNTSWPKNDGLKPKAIKWKRKLQIKKTKKIHQSINPTDLNKRQ